jgi:hypothetical protein
MKKLHLGKILLLLSIPYILLASSVRATLDSPLIVKGDSATLTIHAEGEDVTFPEISQIAGFRVEGSAQSQNIQSINGHTTQSLEKSYTFTPNQSIQIPSYDVDIDGKTYTTKPLSLEVSAPKAADKNAPVQLEMRLAKDEVYVGEPVRLDLIFKKAPNTNFAKIEIAEPELKTFWAKKLPDNQPQVKDGYITQTYSYLLFPQQEGEFTIPATFAKLGEAKQNRRSRMFNDPFFDDPFFSAFGGRAISWKKLFSNEAKLHVKALPENLEIFGDFHISATVDKKELLANKPLNLTLEIKGEGNLDDIKKFTLDIPDAVVYADEPTVDATVSDGSYKGIFRQKIAIVADRNYTIPAVSFSYFDKHELKKKTIQTQPFSITVKGGTNSKPHPLIEEKRASTPSTVEHSLENHTKAVATKKDKNEKYFWLLGGLILGAVVTYLAGLFGGKKRIKKPKKERSVIENIERAKDDKALFELLLPYESSHPKLKNTLAKLEKNLYKQGNESIDKEDIYEIFEED